MDFHLKRNAIIIYLGINQYSKTNHNLMPSKSIDEPYSPLVIKLLMLKICTILYILPFK